MAVVAADEKASVGVVWRRGPEAVVPSVSGSCLSTRLPGRLSLADAILMVLMTRRALGEQVPGRQRRPAVQHVAQRRVCGVDCTRTHARSLAPLAAAAAAAAAGV